MNDHLTTRAHWEETWAVPPRWRLPSSLSISTLNMQRLLRPHLRRKMRVLEIGCAPGKILAWVAATFQAEATGVDYSERGIEWSRTLFDHLGIPADLRCEDVFRTTLLPDTFDLVYSSGVIEHFEDARPIVRSHVALTRPGGKALIALPDYGGIYGRLQRWFDPANLAIHNLEIMSPEALRALAPQDLAATVRSYSAGRVSPWQISLNRRLPGSIGRAAAYALNVAGLLQPVDITPLCPLLVLEITRNPESPC
jgi:2-polyprenyl-3-methyl-5-hydroxy-6-metoxy-1,4-benzoquinol methylase